MYLKKDCRRTRKRYYPKLFSTFMFKMLTITVVITYFRWGEQGAPESSGAAPPSGATKAPHRGPTPLETAAQWGISVERPTSEGGDVKVRHPVKMWTRCGYHLTRAAMIAGVRICRGRRALNHNFSKAYIIHSIFPPVCSLPLQFHLIPAVH